MDLDVSKRARLFLNRQLARIASSHLEKEGVVTHFLLPEFHYDPVNRTGILCFHDFGWELFSKLRNVGFKNVHARVYWSRGHGYLGKDQCVFGAVK